MLVWLQLLQSGTLNFGPCATRGHPKLSQFGRDDPERGAYFKRRLKHFFLLLVTAFQSINQFLY